MGVLSGVCMSHLHASFACLPACPPPAWKSHRADRTCGPLQYCSVDASTCVNAARLGHAWIVLPDSDENLSRELPASVVANAFCS